MRAFILFLALLSFSSHVACTAHAKKAAKPAKKTATKSAAKPATAQSKPEAFYSYEDFVISVEIMPFEEFKACADVTAPKQIETWWERLRKEGNPARFEEWNKKLILLPSYAFNGPTYWIMKPLEGVSHYTAVPAGFTAGFKTTIKPVYEGFKSFPDFLNTLLYELPESEEFKHRYYKSNRKMLAQYMIALQGSNQFIPDVNMSISELASTRLMLEGTIQPGHSETRYKPYIVSNNPIGFVKKTVVKNPFTTIEEIIACDSPETLRHRIDDTDPDKIEKLLDQLEKENPKAYEEVNKLVQLRSVIGFRLPGAPVATIKISPANAQVVEYDSGNEINNGQFIGPDGRCNLKLQTRK